jgi:hypothetical protein
MSLGSLMPGLSSTSGLHSAVHWSALAPELPLLPAACCALPRCCSGAPGISGLPVSAGAALGSDGISGEEVGGAEGGAGISGELWGPEVRRAPAGRSEVRSWGRSPGVTCVDMVARVPAGGGGGAGAGRGCGA